MARTSEQQQRLAFEAKLVAKYFPEFRLLEQDGKSTLKGWVQTNEGKKYTLQIPIPESYPFTKPDLYLMDPSELPMHGGERTINSLGTSHDYHANRNGPEGVVNICHTHNWESSRTFVQILLKGRVWCELYEEHLKTGETIDSLLRSYTARKLGEEAASSGRPSADGQAN
jgi:ubiquitin-protein ligase